MTGLQSLLIQLSAQHGGDSQLRRKLGDETISSSLISGWINDGVVPTRERMLLIAKLAELSQAEVEHLWWEAHAARRGRLRRNGPFVGLAQPPRMPAVAMVAQRMRRPHARVS